MSFLGNILFTFRWNAASKKKKKKSLFPFSCLHSPWALWQLDKIVTENKCCRAKSQLQLSFVWGVPGSCWDTKGSSWSATLPGWYLRPWFPSYSPWDTHFRSYTEQSRSFSSVQSGGRESSLPQGRGGSIRLFPWNQNNLVTVCGVTTAEVKRAHILLYLPESAEKPTQKFHIYFENSVLESFFV